MEKIRLNLVDSGQDLTALICEDFDEFLQIVEIKIVTPEEIKNSLEKLYIGKWIAKSELIEGAKFSIVDPKNGFTGFECIYPFRNLTPFDDGERQNPEKKPRPKTLIGN